MTHLQRMIDAAMAEQVAPLGQMIEDAVGGLTDEQRLAVGDGLQQAVIVGMKVALADACAQLIEQGIDAHLVLAIEPDPPPPR